MHELRQWHIGLPVIDGYEVAQTVRRTTGFEHLPLVAITGYGQASVMAAGFNEHPVKPLDAARISELIEHLSAGQARLPAGGQATPMTYLANGKQYVAIAAGGHGGLGTKPGDDLMVYALPRNSTAGSR